MELFQDHLEALPPDERKRVAATANGQVYLYVQAVLQQSARLQASHSVTHTEHQADAILFVHALKGLYAVATVAVTLAGDEASTSVTEAHERFGAALPDLVIARDALAHPDEYLAGFGKRQQVNGGEYLPWFARSGTSYTVMVGPHAIDVDQAAELALDLASAILTADYSR